MLDFYSITLLKELVKMRGEYSQLGIYDLMEGTICFTCARTKFFR